jgi:hypothetical protein
MRVEPVQPQPRTGDGFGWGGFLAWATSGAALGLTWLSALSIGVFLLLPALILLVVVARRFGGGWHLAGIGAGVGILLLVIAGMHAGESGCTTSGSASSPEGRVTTCSSFNPAPWWMAGSVALLASTGAFVAARTLQRPAFRD